MSRAKLPVLNIVTRKLVDNRTFLLFQSLLCFVGMNLIFVLLSFSRHRHHKHHHRHHGHGFYFQHKRSGHRQRHGHNHHDCCWIFAPIIILIVTGCFIAHMYQNIWKNRSKNVCIDLTKGKITTKYEYYIKELKQYIRRDLLLLWYRIFPENDTTINIDDIKGFYARNELKSLYIKVSKGKKQEDDVYACPIETEQTADDVLKEIFNFFEKSGCNNEIYFECSDKLFLGPNRPVSELDLFVNDDIDKKDDNDNTDNDDIDENEKNKFNVNVYEELETLTAIMKVSDNKERQCMGNNVAYVLNNKSNRIKMTNLFSILKESSNEIDIGVEKILNDTALQLISSKHERLLKINQKIGEKDHVEEIDDDESDESDDDDEEEENNDIDIEEEKPQDENENIEPGNPDLDEEGYDSEMSIDSDYDDDDDSDDDYDDDDE